MSKQFGGTVFEKQVYLFNLNSGDLLHTFNPNPRSDFPILGQVAMNGDRVFIGEVSFDSIFTVNPNREIFKGMVSIFDANTGKSLQTLTSPKSQAIDGFGTPLALSGDKIIIGAPGDDTAAKNSGVAYLFEPASASKKSSNFILGSAFIIFGSLGLLAIKHTKNNN